MFLTTTLAVVMSSVFIQGGTIKYLVTKMKIDTKADDQKSMNEQVNGTLIEHVMSGIDIISGKKFGDNYMLSKIGQYDENYFMKWFCGSDYSGGSIVLSRQFLTSEHQVRWHWCWFTPIWVYHSPG